jgi:hypothetical protein
LQSSHLRSVFPHLHPADNGEDAGRMRGDSPRYPLVSGREEPKKQLTVL